MINITTKRLLIRDFRPDDLSGWHSLFSNAQNLLFTPGMHCETLEESRTRLQAAIDAIHAIPRVKYYFAMELRATNEFIGCIGFNTEPLEGGLLGTAGWFLLPEHQGRGYATEAFAALIPRMFEDWDITVIEARCNTENKASERIMQTCGMTLVKQCDNRLQYQLTKENWEKQL